MKNLMNKSSLANFLLMLLLFLFDENYQVLYILLLLLLLPHFAGLTRMCLVELGERSVKFSCADVAAAAGWVSY